jgi:hypothetical protein
LLTEQEIDRDYYPRRKLCNGSPLPQSKTRIIVPFSEADAILDASAFNANTATTRKIKTRTIR